VLSQVNQAVVRATDPLKLLEVACRAVVTEGGFKVGWIGRMDSDTQYVHTMAACGDAIEYVYGISVSLDDRPEGRGPVGTAIREGRASICNDLFVDPHTEPWRERASRHGLHEMAAFPIRMHGEVWGALALYAGEFGYFGDKEMALLEEAAADIGFALDNLANTAQRQRIEAENDRLAAAIAQAAEIVMITDPEGIIQYVNPAFEKVTGYTRDEARGQNPRLLKSGQQDAAFYRTLWETLVSGHIWEGRFVNKKKDGACYTEEATISPVRDNAGVIVNYVAVKRDITHELNLENQFIHAQKMEVVGRLAGGIAHDFNNILTGVLGFTDLLLESTPDDTLAHADLQEIRRLGQRAADLTRQLLAFSRRQALVMETVDLNALVENTLKMLTRILGEDITLRHELAFGLGTVKADAGQLEQVILNLALNARDAMPHGGVLTIEVADVAFSPEATHLHLGVEFGAYVMLRMTDTGVGMTHDVLAQIFEPFFTTKSVGQGTGLGMATVYGIVKQHGGNIFVSSEPGAGTTCKIYLPRIEEAPVISQSLPIAPKSGDETILLVEDEETVRVVVESMLSMMGYTVCTAEDGAEAERLFREDPARFALLLTDIVMPGINGRELSCRLLAVKPDLKVLFMSGYTANAIVHRGMLDAGVVLLQKPFTMELLGRKVREVLDS
jgi:PAS domain S-box-containing protein